MHEICEVVAKVVGVGNIAGEMDYEFIYNAVGMIHGRGREGLRKGMWRPRKYEEESMITWAQ